MDNDQVTKNQAIVDQLIDHIGNQMVRAKLVDTSFELGLLTDKKPSLVLELVRSASVQAKLRELGMVEYRWNDDALRSELKLADESLIVSICRPR